jgi:hypothetical protein
MLPRVVRAAARVIAVSSFTAREAVGLLGLDETKIRVVPHGVERPFEPEGQAATGTYALAVGTIELRAKGLERVRPFTWDETARRTVEVYREAAA